MPLAQLNFHRHEINVDPRANARPPPVKRDKSNSRPSRTFAKIASVGRPSYNEDSREKYTYVERVRSAKNASGTRKQKAKQHEVGDSTLVPVRDADAIRAC
jgi:hypothetical protein